MNLCQPSPVSKRLSLYFMFPHEEVFLMGTMDIRAINEKVKAESVFVAQLTSTVGRVIVGQSYIVDRMLVGLLADGHILLEGVPGLAKTLAVKTLASVIQAKFQRLQFTPDLLPAD